MGRLAGIEDVAGFVHAKLFENDRELLLQDLADAELDAVLEEEIDGADNCLLADTIHAANPLLDPHGIPRDVVIDDDVTKLEVEPLAAGIRGHQDARFFGELFLDLLALVHAHAAVEAGDRDAAIREELRQHSLGGDELREHQQFDVRVAFLLLEFVNPLQQGFGLGIRSACLDLPGGSEQPLHF